MSVSPFLGCLFCSIDLFVCLLPVPCCHDNALCFRVSLKICSVNPPTLLFSGYSKCVRLFHIHFSIRLSIFTKNPAGVLITIRLHSKLNLGEINIFAVLSLPIHENSIFISSLMSLGNNFLVLVQRHFITFFVKFIPRYLIF